MSKAEPETGATRPPLCWWALTGLAAIKFAAHAATVGGYGIFIDEMYYLDCARHLDWGYVDHPPLSIALLAGVTALFGDSLWALRIPAALIGAASVFIVGLTARGMGGGAYAQGLAGLAALVAPILLGLTSFYSMNAIDLLLWAATGWLLVEILRGGWPQGWLWFGLLAGAGLMNKLSMGFLGAAMVVALLLTPHRRQLLEWRIYFGGLIALIIAAPYIAWQFRHDFATLEFMWNASVYKIAAISPLEFTLAQIIELHPFNALVWGAGLAYAFLHPMGRPWRVIAWIWILLFAFFAFSQSKPYYLAPAYLLLFPLGGVAIEHLTRGRKAVRAGVAGLLAIGGLATAPLAVPALPIETFIRYQALIGIQPQAAEVGQQGALLPQHFADRFGWPELAEFVGSAYASLPEDARTECDILTSSYAAAGALHRYGGAYGLPEVFCTHNNHWIWGLGRHPGEHVLVFRKGATEALLLEYCDEVTELGRYTHPMALPWRNDTPLYHCAGWRGNWDALWMELKIFI